PPAGARGARRAVDPLADVRADRALSNDPLPPDPVTGCGKVAALPFSPPVTHRSWGAAAPARSALVEPTASPGFRHPCSPRGLRPRLALRARAGCLFSSLLII